MTESEFKEKALECLLGVIDSQKNLITAIKDGGHFKEDSPEYQLANDMEVVINFYEARKIHEALKDVK